MSFGHPQKRCRCVGTPDTSIRGCCNREHLVFRTNVSHLTEWEEETLHRSKTLDRALRSNALFVLLLVLVLSPPRRTVLVLVLESIQYSNPTYWSASYREPPRSTIGIAAVQTAIEYEYRFTEYRFAEYEYDDKIYGIYHHPRDGKFTLTLGSLRASRIPQPRFFGGDPSRSQDGISRDMLNGGLMEYAELGISRIFGLKGGPLVQGSLSTVSSDNLSGCSRFTRSANAQISA